MAGGKGSAAKLKLAERRSQAVELRKQGATYRMIAEQLKTAGVASKGYDESMAYDDVMACLREMSEQRHEAAEKVRGLEIGRIEDLWQVWYEKALGGDAWAFDKCMTLMDRRAKLVGIDLGDKPAPDAQNTVVWTPEQWLAETERRRKLADEALALADAAGADGA